MRQNFVRLIAVLGIVAMLFSGCQSLEQWAQGRLDELVQPSPTQQYTHFSKMVYSRPDLKEFETAKQRLDQVLLTKNNVHGVIDRIEVFWPLYDRFYTNLNLAFVHYCADITDPYWGEEYAFCTENEAVVEAAMDQMLRTLAASDYRDSLEKLYFGEDYLSYYDGQTIWDETYMALAEEEAKLQNRYMELASQAMAVEYYSDAYFTQYGSQMAQLLVELVAVRQEMTQYLGYESYQQMAYEGFYYRDYTPNQAKQYCQTVGKELTQIYKQVMLAASVWEEETVPCTEEETFLYVKSGAKNMGGVIEDGFTLLENAQMYDISYGENKYNASFELYFSRWEQPFVFTSPYLEQYDKLVFSHEFGHFLNDYVCGGSYAGEDVAEVHSGGMEYLCLLYADGGEQLELYKLADSLCIFVEQAAYSLFELELYSLSEAELTVENVQKLYTRIGEEFGFDSWEWDPRDYVTIPHLYSNPMYMISYVVSNDVAMQIYQQEKTQPGQGLATYKQCLESEESYIVQFTEDYGLEDPFHPDRISHIRQTFESAFQKLIGE